MILVEDEEGAKLLDLELVLCGVVGFVGVDGTDVVRWRVMSGFKVEGAVKEKNTHIQLQKNIERNQTLKFRYCLRRIVDSNMRQ